MLCFFLNSPHPDVWKTRLCPVVIYEPMETSSKEKEKAAKASTPVLVQVRDITEFRSGKSLDKQAGECSYYKGVDTQMNPGGDGTVWRWCGTGLLFALTSDWQMVKHDPEYTWAVTVFGPTTFTKAGLDIYYRQPSMPPEKLAEVRALIEGDAYLRERAAGLFTTVQDPRGRDRPGSTEFVGNK